MACWLGAWAGTQQARGGASLGLLGEQVVMAGAQGMGVLRVTVCGARLCMGIVRLGTRLVLLQAVVGRWRAWGILRARLARSVRRSNMGGC